jgi:hypothetical protein
MAEAYVRLEQKACLRAKAEWAPRQEKPWYRLKRLGGRHCCEIGQRWCGANTGVRQLEKRRSSGWSEKDRAGTWGRVVTAYFLHVH